MSLLLIKPKVKSFINKVNTSRQHLTRDFIIFALAIIIIVTIYRGTIWILQVINASNGLGSLPKFMPLNGVLFMLMNMLLISNTLVVVSSIYFSQSNDLLLASPVSRTRLFFAKLLEAGFSSSWMPIVFIFPFLLGFKTFYKIPASDFYSSALFLVPFFIAPISFSFIIALLIGIIIPNIKRSYIKFFSIAFVSIIFLYFGKTLMTAITIKDPAAEIYRVLKFLSSPFQSYFPSNWVTYLFEFGVTKNNSLSFYYSILVCSFSISITSFTLILFRFFHPLTYNKVISSSGRSDAKIANSSLINLLEPITKPLSFSFIRKEFNILFREVSSLVEVMLLTSLAFMYAYNLRALSVVSLIPDNQRAYWENSLFLLTSLMTIFLITALCNRLVFPSVSREGKSIWLLKASPVEFIKILKIKHNSWWPVIFVVSATFINISAYALSASKFFIILANFLVLICTFTITKIALGLGSKFSIFDWEHPSQLIASFGSFVFLAVSIFYSAIILLPILLIFYYKRINIAPELLGPELQYLGLFCYLLYVVLCSKIFQDRTTKLGVSRIEEMF